MRWKSRGQYAYSLSMRTGSVGSVSLVIVQAWAQPRLWRRMMQHYAAHSSAAIWSGGCSDASSDGGNRMLTLSDSVLCHGVLDPDAHGCLQKRLRWRQSKAWPVGTEDD